MDKNIAVSGVIMIATFIFCLYLSLINTGEGASVDNVNGINVEKTVVESTTTHYNNYKD